MAPRGLPRGGDNEGFDRARDDGAAQGVAILEIGSEEAKGRGSIDACRSIEPRPFFKVG